LDVYYILSAKFDYDQLFQKDAGPSFASDYGWRVATLQELPDLQCQIAIIDPRMTSEELPELRAAMGRGRVIFVLRIIDPYWEYTREHWWCRFVDDMLDQPRCHVMLTYQPAEITALFAARARVSQFVFAPYVYHADSELPIDHESRSRALFISGACHASIYPVRARIRRVASLWPWLPTRNLLHPGYPDITGHGPRHTVVGDAYIRRLAAFRFAAVCSSRCRLEFLKYREFAYAGVVPVGDMPATLLDCPTDAWISWRRNFIALTREMKTMSDTAERAQRFRRFMRVRRHVDDMRTWVAEQLSRL
jgi:hypothetical protein